MNFKIIDMGDVVDGIYNIVHGVNPNFMVTLNLIGISFGDIKQYRDCGIDYEKNEIWICTKTGSGSIRRNANMKLTQNKYFLHSKIDEYDSVFEWFFYSIPDIIAATDINCKRKKPNWKEFCDNSEKYCDRLDVQKYMSRILEGNG